MISKELLKEVIADNKIIGCAFTSEHGFDAIEYVWIGCRSIDDCYEYFDIINIYELAHMCKEWAFTNEYRIISQYIPKGTFTSSWAKVQNLVSDDTKYLFKCNENTEYEAIFQACQWILDNKNIEVIGNTK